MSLVEARKALEEARFVLDAPYPNELDHHQRAALAFAASVHQQAALEAMWKSQQYLWRYVNELRGDARGDTAGERGVLDGPKMAGA